MAQAPANTVAILIAPTVLGSVAGYFLSIDKRPSSAPRSASLLDYNPSDGLRLSVPALGYSNNNNDQRVRVSLFSGTF